MIKGLLIRYQHLLKEGGWVFFGQVAVAIISLVGLRILTEIAPANLLGGATLWLGILTLLRNVFIAPIGNTQLRFHPEFVNKGQAKWFDNHIKKLFIRSIFISVAIFIIIFFVWSNIGDYEFNILLLLILILYYTLDAIKGYKINRLSAERRQKYFAIWQIIDALLINIFFIVCLLLVNDMESYLAGQAFGILIGLAIFGFLFYPIIENTQAITSNYKEITGKIVQYGLPFIPLAILSWISNLGDRYIISNLLNLNDVGIYTAVYSIASRPFLMINGILGGFFRPILFQEESWKDATKAKRTYELWISTALLISLIGIGIYILAGNFIINLLLAKSYAENVYPIFIIIGITYIIYSLNQIVESRIFSFGISKKILVPNVLAGIVNITANFLLIPKYGLLGAGYASLLSFLIQLIFTLAVLKQISIK
jgi:O-antigen/teichoic acid export membrane protein